MANNNLLRDALLGALGGAQMGLQFMRFEEGKKEAELARADREEAERHRRKMEQLQLAERGIFSAGTEPQGGALTLELVPGLETDIETPNRYQPLGDTGYVQDITSTRAARDREARTQQRLHEERAQFNDQWKTAGATQAKAAERAQLRQALGGMFGPGEADILTALPDAAESVVSDVLGSKAKARMGLGPTGRSGGAHLPDGRALDDVIDREDRRRKAMIDAAEQAIGSYEEDVGNQIFGATTTTQRLDPRPGLQSRIDSLAGTMGQPPSWYMATPATASLVDPQFLPPTLGPGSGAPTRQARLSEMELQLAEAASRAIQEGKDPAKVTQRLKEQIMRLRAGQ